VYWSRTSASSHTRGNVFAKDHARAVLGWLESHGRRVVGGRRVLELEVSKIEQHAALRAAGFDVPRTIAVTGKGELVSAAGKLPAPFITKHNQGGKGLGVRRFESVEAFAAYLDSPDCAAPVDGITLLQEYVPPAEPYITRVEVVGGEFMYAITADIARGGFELCPADACALDAGPQADDAATPSLFALRAGFDDHPIVGRYLDFAHRHGIEIAGFEFIETADGRLVTYDVNTTTNYNAEVEAAAPRSAARRVARFLGGLLEENGGPPMAAAQRTGRR
jgi:glutathione synthase/RimK-type ligase-like ATP-grasp enzyme